MPVRTIPILVALIAAFSIAFAGEPSYGGSDGAAENVFQYPSRGMLGILDPAKLSMSHEMSYFYSTGSRTCRGAVSACIRTASPIRWPIPSGSPCSSDTNSHRPWEPTYGGESSANAVLPGLSISYRPTENTLVRFDYRHLSGAYSPYRPYSLREPYPVD